MFIIIRHWWVASLLQNTMYFIKVKLLHTNAYTPPACKLKLPKSSGVSKTYFLENSFLLYKFRYS